MTWHKKKLSREEVVAVTLLLSHTKKYPIRTQVFFEKWSSKKNETFQLFLVLFLLGETGKVVCFLRCPSRLLQVEWCAELVGEEE